MPRKPDDQYGYDPERQAARTLFDCLEQQADNRPDRPARQLGNVLKVPKVTPTNKRLIEAHAEIIDGSVKDIVYSHSVMCQTSLPYRPTDERVWVRKQGSVSLLIEAGRVQHPDTGEWVELPLPHGEKSRLILMHLNNEAITTGSPIIDMGGNMTAFVRELNIDTNGRNLRTLRDQIARLTAAHITLGMDLKTIKTDVIDAFDLWWPGDAMQRALWPSTVQLAPRYFDSLMKHAVPLDSRAIGALAHSALDLDIYAWLAQRLHRIPERESHTITWQALKAQFGPDYDRARDFRRRFLLALKTVLTVYPDAKIENTDAGLTLRPSPPPVPKSRVVVPRRLTPLTIDATATEITGSEPVD
jgi:hypothetical protein